MELLRIPVAVVFLLMLERMLSFPPTMVVSKTARTLSASWMAAMAPTQRCAQTLVASSLEKGPSTVPILCSSWKAHSISSSNFSALEQLLAVVAKGSSSSIALFSESGEPRTGVWSFRNN